MQRTARVAKRRGAPSEGGNQKSRTAVRNNVNNRRILPIRQSRETSRPPPPSSGTRRPPAIRQLVIAGNNTNSAKSSHKSVCDLAVNKWFAETCRRSLASLKEEFVSLRKHMPSVLRAEVFRANDDKNRYRDVLCLDATRVNLVGHSTNYIHASWVDGSAGEKAFICAQGPMENTSADFWTMIWQEEVALVLMLCDIVENGKVKCFAYWPTKETSVRHGEFSVTRTTPPTAHKLGEGAKAVVCELEIAREGYAPRTVRHLQWADWPDRSVPHDARTVLKLREMCIEWNEGKPVVVHCSAGIGRTGTLVVIDVCIAQLEAGASVDIVTVVKTIRDQRMHSVQTETQYMFIYKALVDHCVAHLGCDRSTAAGFNRMIAAVK